MENVWNGPEDSDDQGFGPKNRRPQVVAFIPLKHPDDSKRVVSSERSKRVKTFPRHPDHSQADLADRRHGRERDATQNPTPGGDFKEGVSMGKQHV